MLAAFFRITATASLFIFGTHADELAFGDVTAKGGASIRFLDDYTEAPDSAGFFDSIPMAAHDWSHVRVILKSLNATLVMAEAVDKGQKRNTVALLSEALKPLYQVMPKNSQGLLHAGTVLYLIHRFYTGTRGWSLKGLPPAGGAWKASMAVTTEVKDISKYILPSYLVSVLLELFGTDGLSLKSVAIVCATVEHLSYSETLESLYRIYKSLGLPTKGDLSTMEAQQVLDVFIMVFVFGGKLQFASSTDVQRALQATQKDVERWSQINAFVTPIFHRMPPVQLDFTGVLSVVRELANTYPGWQSRSCSQVKEHLMALDPGRSGKVNASKLDTWEPVASRPVFHGGISALDTVGAYFAGNQVVIPNFLVSNAMCVSTAGFFMSCCPNECEALLGHLEQELGGPEGETGRVLDLVARLPSSTVDAPRALEAGLAQKLRNAGPHVALHSNSFAEWLHEAYPWECPLPGPHGDSNPKVAAEWMSDPPVDIEIMEDMIDQISDSSANFTHVVFEELATPRLSPMTAEMQEVSKIYPSHRNKVTTPARQPWAINFAFADILRSVFFLASLWATLRVATATWRSASHALTRRCCIPEKEEGEKVV